MLRNNYIVCFILCAIVSGCITPFVPETEETKELVVVEGLITDQYESNSIKLSVSQPLGEIGKPTPLRNCFVTISDNNDNYYHLNETSPGIYSTDKEIFRGVVGRKYTLQIQTQNGKHYLSVPVEMLPVPPVDSLYYEIVVLEEGERQTQNKEGCQIYLDTHDPAGRCRFYRWDYTETWEIQLPFSAPQNKNCWITNKSSSIIIKNVSGLSEARVAKFPFRLITHETDRLRFRYSMLINQYSVSEDELIYWEKLQNLSEESGGLYDITPSTIPGNIYCVNDPGEQVLGYFSVSARTSRRIFVRDNFKGIRNPYSDCISDTTLGMGPIPNLGITTWILEEYPYAMPPYRILTGIKGCADCTERGSAIKPDFWDEEN